MRHRDRDRVEIIGLRNGCDPGPVSTAVADGVERFAWPCPPGAEVELVVADGDGHTWLGTSAQQEWVSFPGPVTMEIDATETIWDFFEQHPMPRSATWSRLGCLRHGGDDPTKPAIHGDSRP